jgi:potassium uptake TrkH family protein
MKERIIGLYKSILMRLQLMLSPMITWGLNAISVINALTSIVVIAILIYALGFPISFDQAIPLPLFLFSFYFFFSEYTFNFIKRIKSHIKSSSTKYKIKKRINPIFVILYGIIISFSIIWLLPTEWLERYWSVFTILRHNYLMIAIVAIEALLKLSAVITHSLSTKISPSWIMVGSFITMIFAGTGLLLLPRATINGISFFDALFTATSAVCVTGLTTIDVASTFTTAGHIIILVLVQLGGIGIMTFTSFFGLMFAGRHPSQNKMLIRDLIDPDNSVSQIFTTLRNIIFITIAIELLGALFIYEAMGNYTLYGAFEAVFHSISAFCNAGFSTLETGLFHPDFRNNYLLLNSLSWLIILGGIGFPILFNLWQWIKNKLQKIVYKLQKRNTLSLTTTNSALLTSNTIIAIIMTIVLVGGGTIIFFITEYNSVLCDDSSFFGKLSTSFFLATVPRTAGFSSFSMGSLTNISVVIMILYMWIGGSPMSTAGGIKTTTFAIALLNVINTLRGRDHIEIRRRTIAKQSINKAFIIIFSSLVVVAFGVIVLSIFEPQLPTQYAIFEVVSAFSTVGLSLNLTPNLTFISKITILIVMFIGRLGTITILSCFISNKGTQFYQYPTEHIPIN